ncbi:hypothetical protein HZU38_05350 [Mycolicibacterium vanbaalenii]|uniref:phage Gp19/Gp15/Gp42 family protein n=1 Tax=Mycolicibacterium vanbaalenii TaxID=110539 RepID=UPI001F2AFFE5|nr:phage Gp19/Gp15/Gp42 family protein [Mycolicibacterium vanbaalenii]UJL29927.1 hypothetical protein HZU38_05350 [Mycolicibacterium vanbaalenii]WND57011.1 phage Gp19/Gp15/Gp42 family protein [Mycolicibacterium vanbaalenii]
MAAFLDVATFATWAKRPDWSSDPVATALLDVVADWIRERKPDLAADDQAAQIVSFEVTRDALMYGDLGPFKQAEKRTAHSSRSFTLDREVVERFVTDRHLRMLGLSTGPRPAYYFGD